MAPGTPKTESMKASTRTVQLRDDQELKEDEAPSAKGCDFFFFNLNLLFGHNFSCLNKHSAEEPLSALGADLPFVNVFFHLQSAGRIPVLMSFLSMDCV